MLKYMIKYPIKKCLFCSAPILHGDSEYDRHKRNCCSRSCANKFHNLIKRPYGTLKKHKKQNAFYFRIKTKNGWEEYHRYLIEKHIGRKLKAYEAVHHINGNSLDNRIENLTIMNRREHSRLHTISRKNGKWSIKWNKCKICKTEKRRHAGFGLCINCYVRTKRHLSPLAFRVAYNTANQ